VTTVTVCAPQKTIIRAPRTDRADARRARGSAAATPQTKEKIMVKKLARHALVGVLLGAVGGVSMANSLGYLVTRDGRGEIEYLDTRPVLSGDLGEVVVTANARR
jgi:hypothetical protein